MLMSPWPPLKDTPTLPSNKSILCLSPGLPPEPFEIQKSLPTATFSRARLSEERNLGDIRKWSHCSLELGAGWARCGLEPSPGDHSAVTVSGVKKVVTGFSSVLRGSAASSRRLQCPIGSWEHLKRGLECSKKKKKVLSQSWKELGGITQLLCNDP